MSPTIATTVTPTVSSPCYRYLGSTNGLYEHPEGVCACFHGGPAPIRTLTALDLVLAASACIGPVWGFARQPSEYPLAA